MEFQKGGLRIGISACLLGLEVRYDGGHKLDAGLIEVLGPRAGWVPVCPEVGCGLPVPREAMRLIASPTGPRLVTVETGIDHTGRLRQWTGALTGRLREEGVHGFILKNRSPSCALRDAAVVDTHGRALDAGPGLFTRWLLAALPILPVEDGESLHDEAILAGFIERAAGSR